MRQNVSYWICIILVCCVVPVLSARDGTIASRCGLITAATAVDVYNAGSECLEKGTFIDPRDGEVYGWVRIGSQVWMAENLRFKTESGSWCWENDEAECKKRGRFYNWETAQRVAPPGWHVASENEWQKLELYLGLTPEQIAQTGIDRGGEANTIASRLKLPGEWPTGYEGKPIEITNDTGFSAVETGFFALGEFTHAGYASWWTSTEENDKAWVRIIGFSDNTSLRALNKKEFANAVRCIKDASPKD
jgi:uncharacterized protein (TIGR02145 family)